MFYEHGYGSPTDRTVQEISSNTSLIREMRMIASYNKLIEQGRMGGGKRALSCQLFPSGASHATFSWSISRPPSAPGRTHSPEVGSFHFSQSPPRPNGLPSFIAIAQGCLAFEPLIASKKAVDWDDTAPPPIGVAEARPGAHGLALGVDRLAPALRVLAPIGNETSAQPVEPDRARLMIVPDHQQVLAMPSICLTLISCFLSSLLSAMTRPLWPLLASSVR